jgi:environmental stress-induced protein Ves
MTPQHIRAQDCAPQPWRNGGGQTRELFAWPPGGDWQLRISRADIEADGPFSAFPGVQRWFAVLQGTGVALQLGGEQVLRAGGAPLCFDGAAAPDCRLLDGPTQDLNLMVRGGRGQMQAARSGQPWSASLDASGLYTATAGQWSDGTQTLQLEAHTLLWHAAPRGANWEFVAAPSSHNPCAYWLGFSPQSAPTGGSA